MKTTAKAVIVVVLLICRGGSAWTQFFSKYELGINAGIFVYQGDLTPERLGSFRTARPDFDFYFGNILSPVFSLRTKVSFGGLAGTDSAYSHPAYRQQRNLAFRSPVSEISELVLFNPLGTNQSKPTLITPYAFTGLGISFLHIRRDDSRFNEEYFVSEPATIHGLITDEDHSLPRAVPVVPIGAGVKFRISQKIVISIETSYRFLFTDYLDGFSRAADSRKKDSYQSYTVGLAYQPITSFARKALQCPVF